MAGTAELALKHTHILSLSIAHTHTHPTDKYNIDYKPFRGLVCVCVCVCAGGWRTKGWRSRWEKTSLSLVLLLAGFLVCLFQCLNIIDVQTKVLPSCWKDKSNYLWWRQLCVIFIFCFLNDFYCFFPPFCIASFMETLKRECQCYILPAIRPLTLWRSRLSTSSTVQLSPDVIGFFLVFVKPLA